MAAGAGLAASGDGAAGTAADAEAIVMEVTSGERETEEPAGALSRPHRLKPVPANLFL
jgi:hypothetical protein